MKAMKENDTFKLSQSVEATAIGENRTVALPAGRVVTVVMVLGDPNSPAAYEVEAFMPDDNTYALATIDAHDIG